jgi:L-seryl-tRNA(Ser) seleniumtransferase
LPPYADKGDVYREINVRPSITASGPITHHGGSKLRPEVFDAMQTASQVMVDVHELNDRAGDILARYAGAEAGMVTSGASCGLLLQAAAVMAGADPTKMDRLPDTTGMRNELIIHNMHRFPFEQGYRAAGAKLVGVGNFLGCERWHIEAAFTDRTAAIVHVEAPFLPPNTMPLPDVAAVARQHGLPVLVDAAEMLPPRENFAEYIRQGADMVVFSGGKGVRGPQGTGIMVGRKDLIHAARANAAPYLTIGRGQKVAKEEIIGLFKATELFMKEDEAQETARFKRLAQHVIEAVGHPPGLEVGVRYDRRHWLIPSAVIRFTEEWKGSSRDTVVKRMREGDPPIFVGILGGADILSVHTLSVDEREIEIVADRLKQKLSRR